MSRHLPPDAQRLRALSHPVRVALLQHLASAGPSTATECAQFVDASPSACSWHLRDLAKAGWIESVAATNGRERPWRYIWDYTNTLAPDPRNPVTESVEAVLLNRSRHQEDAFLHRRSALPPELAAMAHFNFSVIWASPTELRNLAAALKALLQPYTRPDPADRSPDQVRLVTTWTAVPWLARDAEEGPADDE